MIQFNCPNCDRPIKVKPELAGRKGKCPGCQTVLEIPSAEPPPAAESFGTDFRSSSDSDFELEAPAPRPNFAQENFAPSNPYVATAHSQNPGASNQNTGLPLGLGIGSTALGAITLICGCCFGLFQIPFAVLALGLGIGGLILSKGQQGASRVMPIIGTIISSLSALLGIVMIVLYIVGIPVMEELRESIRNQQQQQDMQIQIDEQEVQREIERMRREDQEGLQPFADDGNDPFAEPE